MEFNAQLALNAIKDCYNSYRDFVKSNPLIASEIESLLRWTSYLITATKFNNSQIISELMYSCSSLLALFNDAILRKAANIKINVNDVVERLQLILTILEYIQVFSEFTASKVYGEVGRWVVVSAIQLSKAVIRLVLLLKYEQGMQRQLSIIPYNRAKHTNSNSNSVNGSLNANASPDESVSDNIVDLEESTFKLKRSGRVLRTIENAPPRNHRTWMSPDESYDMRQLLDKQKRNAPPSALTDTQLIGEVLHIIRPVAHLSAIAGFGQTAWTPYLLALGLDVTSLRLLSDPPNKLWNINERIELGQRSFALFAYLLRSPFYDRYTKQNILSILRFFADHIPIFGRIIRPLIDYLPEWQKTYFYVWSV